METKQAVKERPILFSAPMVRAILRDVDPKWQTRRVIKPQPVFVEWFEHQKGFVKKVDEKANMWEMVKCPYGQPGDRLWVRETWTINGYFVHKLRHGKGIPKKCPKGCEAAYAAGPDLHSPPERFKGIWKPSIHMPRWASRIDLEVVKVRVERLQDISEEDAKAEGCPRERDKVDHAICCGFPCTLENHTAKGQFKYLWESINGHGSWHANPWVWDHSKPLNLEMVAVDQWIACKDIPS